MKSLKQMTFDELVDFVLMDMVQALFKGISWRSAMFRACDVTLMWKAEHEKKEK